jgi:hypothetical protein
MIRQPIVHRPLTGSAAQLSYLFDTLSVKLSTHWMYAMRSGTGAQSALPTPLRTSACLCVLCCLNLSRVVRDNWEVRFCDNYDGRW